MRRRQFITLLGGVVAWPLAAKAQQSDQRRRIGVLTALAEDDPENQARLAGFRYGLERRGWSEGRNVRIDYRFAPAGSPDLVQRFAKELVALQPDVLLGQTTPVVTALQRVRFQSCSHLSPIRSARASLPACRIRAAISLA